MKSMVHLSRPIRIESPSTVISQKEYDSLIETLEILNNRKFLLRIESALQNIRKGKTFTHKEVFGHDIP